MRRKLIIAWAGLFMVGAMLACGPAGEGKEEPGSKQAAIETGVKKTDEQRLQDVRSELKSIKAELVQKGEYNCCVQPSCDWCLLHDGDCECYDNLKAGKKVCPGCGLGWHNGNGVVEGLSAKDVKWDITHEHAEGEHQH